MKNISLSIFAAAMLFAGSNVQAQAIEQVDAAAATVVPATDSTAGGIMLLPSQSQEGAVAVLEKEEPVIKNVAHKRGARIGKMVNGYYKMEGHRDWGTNARLSAYGYEMSSPAPAYNPADQPVFPAGVEETEADATAPKEDATEKEANQFDW